MTGIELAGRAACQGNLPLAPSFSKRGNQELPLQSSFSTPLCKRLHHHPPLQKAPSQPPFAKGSTTTPLCKRGAGGISSLRAQVSLQISPRPTQISPCPPLFQRGGTRNSLCKAPSQPPLGKGSITTPLCKRLHHHPPLEKGGRGDFVPASTNLSSCLPAPNTNLPLAPSFSKRGNQELPLQSSLATPLCKRLHHHPPLQKAPSPPPFAKGGQGGFRPCEHKSLFMSPRAQHKSPPVPLFFKEGEPGTPFAKLPRNPPLQKAPSPPPFAKGSTTTPLCKRGAGGIFPHLSQALVS